MAESQGKFNRLAKSWQRIPLMRRNMESLPPCTSSKSQVAAFDPLLPANGPPNRHRNRLKLPFKLPQRGTSVSSGRLGMVLSARCWPMVRIPNGGWVILVRRSILPDCTRGRLRARTGRVGLQRKTRKKRAVPVRERKALQALLRRHRKTTTSPPTRRSRGSRRAPQRAIAGGAARAEVKRPRRGAEAVPDGIGALPGQCRCTAHAWRRAFLEGRVRTGRRPDREGECALQRCDPGNCPQSFPRPSACQPRGKDAQVVAHCARCPARAHGFDLASDVVLEQSTKLIAFHVSADGGVGDEGILVRQAALAREYGISGFCFCSRGGGTEARSR